MPLPTPLDRIVAFLRAGYPEGVPERDYQPLLALLARELPEVEADPSDAEVARVRDHLRAVGWEPTAR